MRWKVEDGSDHLVVRVEGEWHGRFIPKLIDDAARAARESGQTRVLIDCRNVRGHLAENDRFLAGVRIAERFPGIRVTVVGRKDLRVNRRGMNAALRRGAQMLATNDMEEALQWLAQ